MDFPEPVTVDAEIVALVKQRDRAAISKVIESHYRLAWAFSKKIARAFPPSKRDDIVAEAFMCLVKAVNNFYTIEHNELTRYILNCIRHGIREMLIHDNIVYVPNECKTKIKIKALSGSETTEHYNMVDVRDTINQVTTDEIQKTILQLRILGYNDVEIAEKLGVNPRYIGRVRETIAVTYKLMTVPLKGASHVQVG